MSLLRRHRIGHHIPIRKLRPDIQPWAVSQVKGIMGACGAVIHEQEKTNHFLLHNTIQMLFTKRYHPQCRMLQWYNSTAFAIYIVINGVSQAKLGRNE